MKIDITIVEEINELPDQKTRVHRAAIMYANAGFYIIPLRPNTKLLPPKRSGMSYQAASNKIEKMDEWFGPGGKYEGWNIGLVCGRRKGLFVVDLDRHNDVDGVAAWRELLEQHGDVGEVPVQNTPSGGKHLLFQWQENAKSSTSKLGPSIDTRGGDGMARSHIVAWPSVVPDGPYEWGAGGYIPTPPAWVTDGLGSGWPARGNENVDDDDVEIKHTPATIQSMLDAIDINELSYDEWLHIGQAIHSQYQDEIGFTLWHEWSKIGTRYRPNECEMRWKGFNAAGPIRMGTLVYLAKHYGWKPKDHTETPGEFDELVREINQSHAVVLLGGKVKIAHRDEDDNVHILDRADFAALMHNRRVVLPTSGKSVPQSDIWMAHEDRRECAKGIGFFPNRPAWHGGYVNVWRGWGVEPAKGDWTHLANHIRDVICNKDEDLYNFVLDWAADMLQDPMNPKGAAIVMHGVEGSGKGTLAYCLGQIAGHHYKHVTQERHLTGNFNYLLMDAILVFADEVVYGGSRKTAGVLKSLVTEKELVCERKGVDSFMYRNVARLIMASNEDWFIPAGPESRRWLVLEVSKTKANDRMYFDALYNQMENGGYAALMYDLLERNIKSNLFTAPETKALEQQRKIYSATGDSVDEWLDYCVAIGDLGTSDDEGELTSSWPNVVDRILLYQQYTKWLADSKRRSKGSAHFYNKVEKNGFRKFRPKAIDGGPRRYKYKVPPLSSFTVEYRRNS